MIQSKSAGYTLNDGSLIPAIGFGNFKVHGPDEDKAILCAIESGYRYIDSAARYENEADLGHALKQVFAAKELNVQREDLYLLSKVWPSSYDNIEESLTRTLREMQIDYLDAYLLHWPTPHESRRLSAYEQAMRLREKGLFKTLGVSNFSLANIEQLHREFGEYPAINQFECHPKFQQKALADGCLALGIQVIDYRPIDRGSYTGDSAGSKTIEDIAAKYGKTVTQVVLRWHVEHKHVPIPKSATPSRIAENIGIFDFALTPDELVAIDGLETGIRSGRENPETFNGERE